MSSSPLCLEPDWPAPPGVRAASSLRAGGFSAGRYASFNLGAHVGDDPAAVAANRLRLQESLELPAAPVWLEQTHGAAIIRADAALSASPPQADAAYALSSGAVCAVMTADCLPVLLCSRTGDRVAAAHAGWRGLAGGILESSVAALASPGLLAWLGPAIGPEAFEVGAEVRQAFAGKLGDACLPAFRQTDASHWLADLYLLARLTLQKLGVHAIYGGGYCTYSDSARFFSYRRDGQTGRMATLIWRE
jgi:YfiH family protein